MILKIFRSALVFAAVSYCGVAAAWDSVATLQTSLPSDFHPSGITTPDASGYWAWGLVYDSPLLVRYDNGGTPRLIRYTQTEYGAQRTSLRAMPDGGVLVSYVDGFTSLHCVFRRYDASGNLRWTNPNIPIAVSIGACAPMTVDGDGGIWLPGPLRLGVDGSAGAYLSVDVSGASYGDPHGPNLFTAGSVPNAASGNSSLAAIQKTSSSGQSLWKWQAPSADAASTLQHVAIGDDGQIYAFGTIGSSPNLRLYAASLTPEGVTRWTHTYADIPLLGIADVSATVGQGSLISLIQPSGAGSTAAIVKIGLDGAVLWSHASGTADPAFQCGAVLRPAADGDALVAGTCQPTTIALTRFSPGGTALFSRTIPDSVLLDVQVLADGSSLLALLPEGSQVAQSPHIEHIARDGTPLASPQTSGIVPSLDYFNGGTFDANGAAYILSTNSTSHEAVLNRVAADDSITWEQRIDGAWASVGQPVVTLAGSSVCVAGTLDTNEVVRCYSAATGQPGPATQLDHGIGQNNSTIARGIGNGSVVVLYSGSDQKAHHALISANGSIVHDVTPLGPSESMGSTSINAAGDALIRVTANSYTLLAADGTRRFTQTLNAGAGTVLQTYLADDGSGLLLTTNGGLTLARIDATGAIQWSQPAPVTESSAYNFAPSIRVAGGNAYLVLGVRGLVYGESAGRFPALVFKASLADGAIAWSTTVQTGLSSPLLMLDAGAQNLLVIAGLPNKISEVVLDTATGATRDARFEACPAGNCTFVRSGIRSDGALRVLVDTSSDTLGYLRQMYTRQHPFAARTSIRVDQAGISGAWFPTYSGGQGFTLDYIASANTIFMPWFTFAANMDQFAMYGINDTSGLAWYALQGAAPANATSTDLAIAVTDSGAFNTGQLVAHQVGTAHLTLSDCNNATLYFQFDPGINSGAGGLISLTRLTPGTAPCMLADGSTTPPQNSAAPANGFDARQSGSWFDPNTGGQGLEISIIPASNGSNGLVFAAWFTFDPSGKSDDALNQHWFTLQGDLASAANGKITLPIYRIIGGSFNGTPAQNYAQVGHAILTMQGCDAAQLDYRFDTAEVTHAFAGLTGTSHLVKIGGCSTP